MKKRTGTECCRSASSNGWASLAHFCPSRTFSFSTRPPHRSTNRPKRHSTNCCSESCPAPPSCRSATAQPLRRFTSAGWPSTGRAIISWSGRQISCPPSDQDKYQGQKSRIRKRKGGGPEMVAALSGTDFGFAYFRLPSVRSADSLAMKLASHQLEVGPALIAFRPPVPLAVGSLVKALQSPLLRSVSL